MRFPGGAALNCWGGGAAWTASSEKADHGLATIVNLFYNGDGSIDIYDDFLTTLAGCTHPAGVAEQEERYVELLPKFERYRIYGDLLVVHTEDGAILLFQAE